MKRQPRGPHSGVSAGFAATQSRIAPAMRLLIAASWALTLWALYRAVMVVASFDRHIIGNMLLNSDALYPFLYWGDVLDGGFPAGWMPPPASTMFPDMLLALPAVWLGRIFDWEPVIPVLLSAALMGIAWLAAYECFVRVLARYCSWNRNPALRLYRSLAVPLGGTLVFFWIRLELGGRMLEYLLVPTYHIGAAIVLPLLMACTLIALLRDEAGDADQESSPAAAIGSNHETAIGGFRAGLRHWWQEIRSDAFEGIAPRRILALVALAALIAGTLASDRVFYLASLFPLLVATPILGAGRISGQGWYVLTVCGSLLLARIFAGWFDRLFLVIEMKPNWARLLEPGELDALAEGLSALNQIFFGAPGVPIYLACAVLFVVGFRLLLRGGDRPDRFLLLWMIGVHLAMVPLLLAGMIVIGYVIHGSPAVLRYLAPAASMLVIPAVLCVFALVNRPSRSFARGASVAVVALLLLFTWLPSESYTIAEIREQSDSYRLARCLETNRGRVGRFGFSDYWTAKAASYFSSGAVMINQLNEGGGPLLWINNYDWFYRPHRDGEGYGFLVLDRLDPGAIEQRFGPPVDRIQCGPSWILVYGDRPAADASFRFAYPPEHLEGLLRAVGRFRGRPDRD